MFVMLAPAVAMTLGAQPAPQAWGEPVQGLQMSISQTENATVSINQTKDVQSKVPKFRIDLRNTGETDLILNVGMMLANGRNQYVDAIFLTLTDALGKSRQFALRGPGLIAGRVDPLIVPLPVGAGFSLPVDIDNYWAAASKEYDYKLAAGTYSIEAQFTGLSVGRRDTNLDVQGIALMPYWNGTVRSNSLQFEVPR